MPPDAPSSRPAVPHAGARAQVLGADLPGQGLAFGVGMPVMLRFSEPVPNKKAMEESLRLWAPGASTGPGSGATARPCTSARAPTGRRTAKVRFVGHLDGVEGAPGVYSDHTLRQDFQIGSRSSPSPARPAPPRPSDPDKRLWATWPISADGQQGSPKGTA